MKLLSITVASVLASASAGAASVDSVANRADERAADDVAFVTAASTPLHELLSQVRLNRSRPSVSAEERAADSAKFAAMTATGPTLPHYTRNYSAPIVNATMNAPPPVPKVMPFQHVVLGTDPALGGVTSVIPVRFIPIVITAADGTVYDPTAELVPNQNGTVVELELASPIFTAQPIPFAGGEVTQLLDAWVRNERWQYTQSMPNYHVLLNPSVAAPMRLQAKASQLKDVSGQLAPNGSTWGEILGRALAPDTNWLDGQIRAYLQAHPAPTVIPVFVTAYNVGLGGYHSSVGAQAYIWHTYNSLQAAPAGSPVEGMTIEHELAELIDHPFPTTDPDQPACVPFGFEGAPIGYEVGDPLNFQQADFLIANPQGVLYHFQDLTYASWNEGQVPSQARGGRYSIRNAFRFPCF